jgi:hypothetical protein
MGRLRRSRMTNDAGPDLRYQVAYDEAKRAIDHQNTALESLRTRAAHLISITAVITSFAIGVGLIETEVGKDPALPPLAPYTLLALLVLIGLCAILVLVPDRWHFVLDAEYIIKYHIESSKPKDLTQLNMMLAIELQRNHEKNKQKISWMKTTYHVGAALLLLEVSLLVVAVMLKP